MVSGYDKYVAVFRGTGDGTFHDAETYPTNPGPTTIALGDFNHDGKTDIAVAETGVDFDAPGENRIRPASVSILLSNGDGTFEWNGSYGLGDDYPLQLLVADFDGDGRLDIAVGDGRYVSSRYHSAPTILFGNGDGTFQAPRRVRLTTGELLGGLAGNLMAAADLDGDGTIDLVSVPFSADDKVYVLLGGGRGTFRPPVSYSAVKYASAIVVGDFNGDGKPDLVVSGSGDTSQPANVIASLLGNGDGTFTPPIKYDLGYAIAGPVGIAAADLNGDGHLDLIAAHREIFIATLLGRGDGSFGPPMFPNQRLFTPLLVAVGDFNGDGRPDLAFSNDSKWITVLLNTCGAGS
jgi:hypothetical protein